VHNQVEGKRSRTKKKLIDAAAAVIGEKGFDRASLEEIAARAGMTRGAVYGNFKNKDELFLALIATVWKPIMPPLKPGASLKQQMRILGKAVASEAQARRPYAAAAAAFQLYAITHKQTRSTLTKKNAAIYKWIATVRLRARHHGHWPLIYLLSDTGFDHRRNFCIGV
jgi:TetR/AcrR family acrAB operon transcriptional repressor